MKHTLLTMTFLLCATFSCAQKLAVESFTHDAMNLEARLDGGRTDLNGKQCALVKVLVRDDIVKCKGGNIGNIITEGVIKKIFVSPSARFLELEFQYSFPIKMTFADYGYATLSEGSTYTVTLVDAYLLSQKPIQPQNQQQSSTSSAQNQVANVTTSPQGTPSNTSTTAVSSSLSGSVLPVTVNGVTFNMIRVDGGTFTMGATKEQKNKTYKDEKPKHNVTLSTYYIGETEVTQALWIAVMGENLTNTTNGIVDQALWQAVMGINPSHFTGDNLPVHRVSWNDCKKFIQKLNSLTGKSFRFPTEAEWEFAARGGNKSCHTQYSGSSNIDEVAWYWQNSGRNSGRTPHPVKTKKPNELGIYDMSGNVYEWCQDWYGSYSSNAQINPTGPSSGTNRVCRGGSWDNSAGGCRSAFRYDSSPEHRYNTVGLRLVLSE
ncbi:MAG: formylglycine-generating enzyme family protein [Bacteroidales bacterium]|nr:formylglycine-generating enzyme family protein [Bacteroidales bacterium]